MSETTATPNVCVVCKSDSKNLVADPDIGKYVIYYTMQNAWQTSEKLI
jgi:hypothetical protein